MIDIKWGRKSQTIVKGALFPFHLYETVCLQISNRGIKEWQYFI